MKGKYIYGIMTSNGNVELPIRGVYTVSYNNLSAIVKDAPIKTYDADEKALLAHNSVLDKIIRSHTVLPMRFGTVARTEVEVKDILKNAYSVLSNRLLRIRDKVEFDIEISIVNEQSIIKEILEKNKEIQELRDKLISQGQNVRVQDKLLIGKMIANNVARYKIDVIKDILTTLKPYYALYKLITDTNIAFLVTKNRMVEFESTIYKLGERYGDRLKFKYTGPLAPYSFVELRLVIINFNTVDNARRQLGLGEEATFNDIKGAYRALAKECHPDKNPGKEEEFKKLAGAYRLLHEYSRRYPKARYVFKPEEIDEFSVLVEEE